jgi:hypothetical protein
MSINNAGQYNQSQQATQQTVQQAVQQSLNQTANNNNGNNGGLLNQVLNMVNQTNQTNQTNQAQQASEQINWQYTDQLPQNLNQNFNQSNQTDQFFQQGPQMPNPYPSMTDAQLKEEYGFMTQDLASDPDLENESTFMMYLYMAHDEMIARGLLNSDGMQGAPRNLGFLSGSSTSTSSTSAHGDMRMHVARMNQADPRADLYEY